MCLLFCFFFQPNLQTRAQREGSESEKFWELLGGKSDYPSQKPTREPENDPHLFACAFTKGTFAQSHHLSSVLILTLFLSPCFIIILFIIAGNGNHTRKSEGMYIYLHSLV